jgi:chaperonin GroEL
VTAPGNHLAGRQIANNARVEGSVVIAKILENDNKAYGYDAQSGEYGDLVSKGIIDPAKVVRTTLQGAASVAGLLIMTEAMVAELPGPPPPALPGHDHDHHHDMDSERLAAGGIAELSGFGSPRQARWNN